MARNVREKLANGQRLDDDDVRYAVDRGIDLPEEYEQKVKSYQYDAAANFGRPPSPVVDGGQYPGPNTLGPGLFLTDDQLMSLKKDELLSLADATGIEASGTKAEIVSTLTGSEVSGDDEDEDEDKDED